MLSTATIFCWRSFCCQLVSKYVVGACYTPKESSIHVKLIRIITTKVYANAITVVCILVGMKSFQDSEETIHGAEINDTSYESQADFTFTKGEQKFNYNFKINLTLLCDSGS